MNANDRARVRKVIRALDGPRGLERLETMPMDDEGFGFDRFGFERESFYMAYLVATALLGFKVGWSLTRMVLVMLAGCVPFLSFWVESRVAAEVEAGLAEIAAWKPAGINHT